MAPPEKIEERPAPAPQPLNIGSLRKLKLRKTQAEPIAEGEARPGESNGVAKKRRWGTSQLLPNKRPALVISTDSLKVGSISNVLTLMIQLLQL